VTRTGSGEPPLESVRFVRAACTLAQSGQSDWADVALARRRFLRDGFMLSVIAALPVAGAPHLNRTPE